MPGRLEGKVAVITGAASGIGEATAIAFVAEGQARDVAAAAVYLASDEAAFVNCHDLVVDAGRTAMFNERPRS